MCNDLVLLEVLFGSGNSEAAIHVFLSLGHRSGPKVDMAQENPH